MNCTLLICCQSIITDKQTNNTTLINLYDEVYPISFPHVTSIGVYITIKREISEPPSEKMYLKIYNEKSELSRVPITVNFLEGYKTANAIINFEGILINQPSVVTFELLKVDGDVTLNKYSIKFNDPKEKKEVVNSPLH